LFEQKKIWTDRSIFGRCRAQKVQVRGQKGDLQHLARIFGSKSTVTFNLSFFMQIPFSVDFLELRRDHLQSLSTFYRVVKKIFDFEDNMFDRFRPTTNIKGQILGQKAP